MFTTFFINNRRDGQEKIPHGFGNKSRSQTAISEYSNTSVSKLCTNATTILIYCLAGLTISIASKEN